MTAGTKNRKVNIARARRKQCDEEKSEMKLQKQMEVYYFTSQLKELSSNSIDCEHERKLITGGHRRANQRQGAPWFLGLTLLI